MFIIDTVLCLMFCKVYYLSTDYVQGSIVVFFKEKRDGKSLSLSQFLDDNRVKVIIMVLFYALRK